MARAWLADDEASEEALLSLGSFVALRLASGHDERLQKVRLRLRPTLTRTLTLSCSCSCACSCSCSHAHAHAHAHVLGVRTTNPAEDDGTAHNLPPTL